MILMVDPFQLLGSHGVMETTLLGGGHLRDHERETFQRQGIHKVREIESTLRGRDRLQGHVRENSQHQDRHRVMGNILEERGHPRGQGEDLYQLRGKAEMTHINHRMRGIRQGRVIEHP